MSFRQNTVKSAYETETADRSARSRGVHTGGGGGRGGQGHATPECVYL